MKKKIFLICIFLFTICIILTGCDNKKEDNVGKTKNRKFKAVAHVANIGLSDTNNLFISPQLVNAWYFEETEDVVICFTGENTTSNFYAYFMNGKDFNYDGYIGICTSTEPLTKSNLIFSNSNTSIDRDSVYAIMCEIMQSQNKLEKKDIEEINELINNGKIKNY